MSIVLFGLMDVVSLGFVGAFLAGFLGVLVSMRHVLVRLMG